MISMIVAIVVLLGAGATPAHPDPDQSSVTGTWYQYTSTEHYDKVTFEDHGVVTKLVVRAGKRQPLEKGTWEQDGSVITISGLDFLDRSERPVTLRESDELGRYIEVNGEYGILRPESIVLGSEEGGQYLSVQIAAIDEHQRAIELFSGRNGKGLEYKEPDGSAYRISFRDGKSGPHFEVVLWPKSKNDANRLEELARQDLKERGLGLKIPIEVDRQGY